MIEHDLLILPDFTYTSCTTIGFDHEYTALVHSFPRTAESTGNFYCIGLNHYTRRYANDKNCFQK